MNVHNKGNSSAVMRALMLFIDGLGIGERDRLRNPMASIATRWFEFFLREEPKPTDPPRVIRETNATLGVKGVPQSATGQTTLLTGINAARQLDRHINGFCTRHLEAILNGHSLFLHLLRMGKKPTFANAYTPPFFEGKMRFRSVTTVASSKAGLPFRSLQDLQNGRALYQDFSNGILRERGYDVPSLSPQEAGRQLAELALDHDFTLYEYFQTDIAGHSQEMERCQKEIERLDAFLDALIHHLDLDSALLVLSSDHGNIEDLSIPGHTCNPVPTILWGSARERAGFDITSLTDVAPAIIRTLEGKP